MIRANRPSYPGEILIRKSLKQKLVMARRSRSLKQKLVKARRSRSEQKEQKKILSWHLGSLAFSFCCPRGKVQGGCSRGGARAGGDTDSQLATCQLQPGMLTE